MRLIPILLLAVLTGCGLTRTVTVAGDDVTTVEQAASDPAGDPTWPSEGCDIRASSISDYADDSATADSREDAAARYVRPGDRLVRQEPQPKHHRRGWYVVTPDGEIRAQLNFWHADNGWLVDGVEECSG